MFYLLEDPLKFEGSSWSLYKFNLYCSSDDIWNLLIIGSEKLVPKIVNEYDQETPQSQTADNPVAPRGRDAQPSQDTRKTN